MTGETITQQRPSATTEEGRLSRRLILRNPYRCSPELIPGLYHQNDSADHGYRLGET
jgi:hypothetical protein